MVYFVDEHAMLANGTIQENGINENDKTDCADCGEDHETQNDDNENANVVKQEDKDND